tara:strand:- start:9 stop:479 length:471 start_codon:yes stop_codon:yes gene_type:complete
MQLKGVLAFFAPTVGKALGSPISGLAVQIVADAIGVSNTTDPAKIEKYIEEHPECIGALQAADDKFRKTLEERKIDLDVYKRDKPDTQHAREMFGSDPTPKVFAIISLVGFLAYIFLVSFNEPENDSLANVALGYLGALISGIASFFFGSSNNRPK